MQKIYGGCFDIDKSKQELLTIQKKTEEPDFWNNRQVAEQVIKDISDRKNLITSIEQLKEKISNNLELLELIELEPDEELQNQLEEYASTIDKELEQLSLVLLLNGPYDKNNCIGDSHSMGVIHNTEPKRLRITSYAFF